ncbi:F-box/LRR-repeat protein 14 [Orchesella cincta]|uniref:F-box/LRR-repeat protein 14 n=1 Tax=Orchesella cincta TaxID=48709 RepID=A0A1D2MR64_ORCCI|nr:F-box/LRR-repeat protein 14 [Orchesella cincta]
MEQFSFNPYREVDTMFEEPLVPLVEGKNMRKLTLSDLYPEILTQIFGYLDTRDKSRVAQCCQYFNEICKNRQMWKGTEARLNLKPNQNPIYQSLSVRGVSNVQVLSLKRSLRDLTSHVPIKKLKLSGCYNVTDYSLSSTVNLENLVDLDLSLCKQITDLSLYSIVGKAKNLQRLDLGGCCNLTDRGLLLISYGLRNLVKLDLRSCYSLTDRALAYLAGEVQINEPKTFNFLAKVGLIENPNCVICKRGGSGGASSSSTSSSSSRASNKVVLPKIDEFTKFGMLKLQSLVLQDCQKISDTSLDYISRIPSIQSLNLSFCVNITDNGLKHLKKLPKLSELNLRSCDNITDTALINLKDCPTIQHLDVSFCEKICNLNYHLCRHLRTLSLSACDISDSALMAVDLGALETLNLGQCRKLSDLGLRAIAEKCTRLKYIDLYGCSGVSTKGIEAIMGLSTLKHVNLGLWKV